MFLQAASLLVLAATAFAEMKYLDELRIPFTFKVAGIEIGGMSGLTYNPKENVYYTIVDKGSRPFAAFNTLRLGVDKDGWYEVDLEKTTPLLSAAGTPREPGTFDPQAIAYHGLTDTIFWADQKDEHGYSAVFQSKLDGSFIREFSIPDYKKATFSGEVQTGGLRPDCGFQGMALLSDYSQLYVMPGCPITQARGMATAEGRLPVGMLVYDVTQETTVDPLREHIYEVEPVPEGYTDNRVTEITMLDDEYMLVMETARNAETNDFLTRIYKTRLGEATDVLGKVVSEWVPMEKELIKEISEATMGFPLDRLSHMAFGAPVDGQRLLFTGSNNDFAGRPRFTQSLAWLYQDEPVEPPTTQ